MDIEYIAAHEVTHGLGFFKGFHDYSHNRTAMLLPALERKYKRCDSSKMVWSAPTGFDRLLFDPVTNKNLTELVNPSYGSNVAVSGYPWFEPGLEVYKNEETRETGKRLMRLAKNAIGIRMSTRESDTVFQIDPMKLNLSLSDESLKKWKSTTTPKQVADLQTSRRSENIVHAWTSPKYLNATTMDHLSQDYERTPNFLMCGKIGANFGLPLDDIIRVNSLDGQIKTYGIYGYELTKIMTDIGWPSEIDPTRKKVIVKK